MKKQIIVLLGMAMLLMTSNAMATIYTTDYWNYSPDATVFAAEPLPDGHGAHAILTHDDVADTLTIELINTGDPAEKNIEVLLGFFLQIDGCTPFIGAGSSATATSLVNTDGTVVDAGPADVGDFWAYADGLSVYDQFIAGGGYNAGI